MSEDKLKQQEAQGGESPSGVDYEPREVERVQPREVERAAAAPTPFVWLTASGLRGRFSENGMLLTEKVTTVQFITDDTALDAATLDARAPAVAARPTHRTVCTAVPRYSRGTARHVLCANGQ